MPVVQLDWVKLLAKVGDVTDLYFLTHRQASLLLSISEQLTWKKTYRIFDYDYSDWDDLQLEVADLQRYLAMPVDLVQLVGYIDEVEDLLRALQTIGITPCCDNLAPISEKKTTDEDYPGTPPAEWGDGEAIADSDDWEELVCGAAHIYVDLLKGTADELEQLVVAGGIVIGAVAGALALLAGAGIILAVGYGFAAGITTGLLEGIILGTFGDAVEDLEDARADIVCAIVHQGPEQLAYVIESTVSGLAWSLWFQFIDYDSAWPTMVDGYNKNGFLGVSRSADCECEPFDLEIVEDFETADGRDLFNPDHTVYVESGGTWQVQGDSGIRIEDLLRYTGGFDFETGDKLEFYRVKFDSMRRGSPSTRFIIRHDGGTEVLVLNDSWPIGVYERDLEFTFSPPLVYTYPGGTQPENFEMDVTSGHTNPFLDNIELDINIINV